MNKLITAIENETNVAYTDNAAKSLRTSKSDVLDFFALGGAMRKRSEDDINKMFSLAYAEDKLLALKTAAYLRDIRGGQGERRTFRTILKFMGQNYPKVVRKNLQAFVDYGRWDDLFVLFGTELETDVLKMIEDQFNKDIVSNEGISLLGKWLPSENTSSKVTKERARKVREYLELTPRQYRKHLSALREKLRIVERDMCAKNWENINYETVPSRASLIYRKAFGKHDADRYSQYLTDVENGAKEIKATTLYPYDIVERALRMSYGDGQDRTLDAQWKALPDYCKDNPNPKGLVVADVSGSMSGRPITISISLAIYLAERNKGVFQNTFITFSAAPELQKIKGDTIVDKCRNLSQAHWDMNTDVQAVFNLILNTALKNKIKQSDMPDCLYIISDMQFDQACSNNDKTNFQVVAEKYKNSGYKMPKLVFWNVNAFNTELPVSKDEINTVLVSGASPTIFKTVLSGTTPYEVMLSTLNQERYSKLAI